MKRCTKCGKTKPLEAFDRQTGTRDGLRPDCKACVAARRKASYARNKERELERVRRWQQDNSERFRAYRAEYRDKRDFRAEHLRRTFGLTPDDDDRMLAEQGGGCAICGRTPKPGKHLHVDHDHETGRVRGLLCFGCNVGVGSLQHDERRIQRAIAYLDDDPDGAELLALARARARDLTRAASG